MTEEDVNTHLGKRLRRRRRLLGQTQQVLGTAVEISFQQIQKYECGASRITAARLYLLAKALQVPVEYFYDGLDGATEQSSGQGSDQVMSRKETMDLVRAYYQLGERPRRRVLDLAISLKNGGSELLTEPPAEVPQPATSAAEEEKPPSLLDKVTSIFRR